jgi:hypothetical protein
LFASKWMELENIMKLAKFRMTKCICFAHMWTTDPIQTYHIYI